jgi:intron-binding protein aquarius
LVNVVKRLKPVLRQSNIDDDGEIKVKTEFNGWSRMAIELAKPFQITEVQPPKLGETISSRVTAEVVIDLEPCGPSIRTEWDEVGEFHNLFLVAIDASKMTGNQAPLLKDYHLHHGSHKVWDSDSDRRVPDEEGSTFCERFGITLVRGCMVVQVRNEAGTVLSEPGVQVPEEERKNTKRVFKVLLDSFQYGSDSKSAEGSDMYQKFNIVVRRHGRENNFKAVLETVRGLLEGAGSIDRVIPPWLQTLILGHGDPTIASYKSDTIKQYSINTVGVNKPTDFLDFGDTFLDENHIAESFGSKVVVEDGEALDISKRYNFKLRFLDDETHTVQAIRLPHQEKSKGNPVRFTPVQVEAIRSGLLPGLTLVVGPPGTGKTDVAVQIISSLYHTYPTQRTIIITHSNAALNDIFSKVMARGDIDERYFVRLGAGERDLETESSHDFTKIGRVAYSIHRRGELLEQVQQLSESLGVSGKAQRGADGSPSYTCETADYFRKQHLVRRQKIFENQLAEAGDIGDDTDVSTFFPFALYFGVQEVTLAVARNCLIRLEGLFKELAEYRPFELLRSQRQRADYLITKQARIVAMTCTHAAIVRSNLIEIGFEYDNLVMEESAQMLEIESFIPCLLQKGKSDDAVSGLSRLKRVCMLGDHNQLPPVVKNAAFASFSNFDQSLFARLIRLGVPYVQLDKQGRARPEIMKLYRFVPCSARVFVRHS